VIGVGERCGGGLALALMGAGTTFWQCQARACNESRSDREDHALVLGGEHAARGEALRWICADLLAGPRSCDRLGDSRTKHRYGE
jgi:hypothetical protein